MQGLDQLADQCVAAQRVINSVLGGFNKPVLLVFDNLENERLMRTWLPRTGARALATSRNATWSADVTAIPLGIWSLETAIDYLRRGSGRTDFSDDEARAIAEVVGALPLALAHAAASLRNARMARRPADRPILSTSKKLLFRDLGRRRDADGVADARDRREGRCSTLFISDNVVKLIYLKENPGSRKRVEGRAILFDPAGNRA